jgi:hypothetical protein
MDAIKTIKRMKSIKEKSNEYANEQDLRMAYNGSCDNCQQGFESGANYVLDEIEKLAKFINSWAAQDLYELIEQLKK